MENETGNGDDSAKFLTEKTTTQRPFNHSPDN
jgi:hypothetical protein